MSDKTDELLERLEEGIEALKSSDRWIEMLKVFSKLHSYSFRNSMLICLQRPDATMVAGFNTWKTAFGRHVKKGEKGIYILAPCKKKYVVRAVDEDGEEVEKAGQTVVGFKAVSVFDVSQTEGKDIPSVTSLLSYEVDGFDQLWDALVAASEYPVVLSENMGSANGCFSPSEGVIKVKRTLPEAHRLKTLAHELAHSKLHGDKDGKVPRDTAEVEAESTAYVVCDHFGIDSSEYTFGYIAGWANGRESEEIQGSLERIKRAAKEIIDAAEARTKAEAA